MYCSIGDVRIRNPILLDREYYNDEKIQMSIEYAQSVVNGYLENRYGVPLIPVPALIRSLTADLAAAKALAQSVGNTGIDKNPVQAEMLREDALGILRLIRDGSIGIEGCKRHSSIRSSTYKKERIFEEWDPGKPDTYLD